MHFCGNAIVRGLSLAGCLLRTIASDLTLQPAQLVCSMVLGFVKS